MTPENQSIETERLILRPLLRDDAPAIRDLIFSDPEVAKGLFHDISQPEARRRFAEGWCDDLGWDGNNKIWAEGGLGGFAILDRRGDLASSGVLLGIVGFYGADKSSGLWTGELFYALGGAFHGKRIMSEACRAAMDAFCALAEPGEVYAVYWTILNPASGHILKRLGFEDIGAQRILDEYSAERALSLHRFEMWRLGELQSDALPQAAREAAIKLGHLASEDLLTERQALADIEAAISGRLDYGAIAAEVEAAFRLGRKSQAMSYLRFRPG